MVLLGFAIGIALFAAAVYSAWFAVNWVLGPLDRAAKNRAYPVQFSLADFLCLFVQVQLVLAWPAMLFRSAGDRTADDKAMTVAIAVTVIVFALVLLIWWTGVRTLSRAGIHRTLGRALTLTVAIPFGYASAVAIPIVAAFFVASLVDSHGYSPLAGLLLLAEFALIAFVWGMGLMTRRIIASARKQEQTEPPPG